MLGIGSKFPEFNLTAVLGNNEMKVVNSSSYNGKWMVFFFWPKDFTFVCPTEISGFADLQSEFEDRSAQILGASMDSEFVHLAWKKDNAQIGKVNFPMLADIGGNLSSELGIKDVDAGVSQRATYIIDPNMVVRYASVTDLNVGRNPEEVLRILDALQNGGLCPVNWKKGESTLNPDA
ncbi:peroxiredoxin [Candidatus Cytomitobacter indipagum]|uniref:Alkyl hydroperoxide reductase C n=1 Tax=Candidatus Cytomitobacter indipagum TaxID=2601575 RepID=A0A5C0UDM6_9PROT|nr:peroxiredoxin [Candidatus Cytomitobacter indipagum]QEK38155.1 peroxiredoxin [Candidatus Cytomitobacter indipagum]